MSATTSARMVLIFALLAGSAVPAAAQRSSETGTGGSPDSTIKAPNTTGVGQTKPPGAAGVPESPGAREERTRTEKKNDAIETGICIGCNK